MQLLIKKYLSSTHTHTHTHIYIYIYIYIYICLCCVYENFANIFEPNSKIIHTKHGHHQATIYSVLQY